MATKNLQYESGRSMVEMLGTLAIIGVLSIGGIAGYKYGMDKYKANQTINDVMLMGVDMITQLSQNRGTPTLSSDWGTKTTAGYDFTVVPNPEDETQYGIQITGVPSSICKMVGDGLKQTVAVYVGNEDYNSNTETDPCDESNSNTMEFYFEHASIMGTECKTNTDCGEGNYCDNGWCFSGDKPEITKVLDVSCTSSEDCNINWTGSCAKCLTNIGKCVDADLNWGYACTLKTGNVAGQCYNGECVAKGCNDTRPCADANKFCASLNSTYDERFREGEEGACVKPDFKHYEFNGKIYYISNSGMSWWDAEAACQALSNQVGKKLGMITMDELSTDWKEGYSTLTSLSENIYEKLFDSTGYPSIVTANTSGIYGYNIQIDCGWVIKIGRNGGGYAICR